MTYFINKLNEIIKVFYTTKSSKKYIEFNNKIWNKKNNNSDNNGEILLDLFHHYPFINIWSYIVNLIKDKKKYKVKYFYFHFYKGFLIRTKFYSHKLKEIYKSFNVEPGIDERNHDFNKSNKKINKFLNIKNEKKIKFNINDSKKNVFKAKSNLNKFELKLIENKLKNYLIWK